MHTQNNFLLSEIQFNWLSCILTGDSVWLGWGRIEGFQKNKPSAKETQKGTVRIMGGRVEINGLS